MAKSKNNEVMQGASGKIGRNLVFRQRGDQTVIARRARVSDEGRSLSDKQVRAQNRFADAVLYAKKAVRNEELKAAYQSRATVNQSAFNVAFKDFMTPPQVRRLDDRSYMGVVGDKITFFVKDVLKVTDIQLEILDENGTLVESGPALAMDEDHVEWSYTATVDYPEFEQATYRIAMLDTPKNTTVVTKAYGEDQHLL